MNKFKLTLIKSSLLALSLFATACSSSDEGSDSGTTTGETIAVDISYFIEAGLAEPITIVSRTMSDGTTADCYKIVVKGIPTDHEMGPWCPGTITDDASAGGIWLENGNVYDVDGAFVQNLATFYNDNTWMLYNSTTGVITKTATIEECEAAANPNVGAEFENYCVECLPSYVADLTHTYYIPVTPQVAATPYLFATVGGGGPGGPGGPVSTGPSVRGMAFNGVVFDAPAPVDNILGAYTLAPFDDAGGHINLAAGYHYHAATGLSKQIVQTDGHAPMIGYALDGFGLFANTDANGTEYTDLDAARGHTDAVRGYHYHVDKAGNNNFINGLNGLYAE